MGIKKGVNALTKTMRIIGILSIVLVAYLTLFVNSSDPVFAFAYAGSFAVILFVVAWILDSFVADEK